MNYSQIEFLRPENLNGPQIVSWFTLKNAHLNGDQRIIPGLNVGFNSNENQDVILKNLNILSAAINTPMKDIALANQIHSSNVELVDKGGIYPDTDAFVTKEAGLALAIQVADCGAVLLGDPKNKIIGIAHAGWRGAVAGIVPKVINMMIELGAERQQIRAFVSPCLSMHNFEVGEEVADQFSDHLVDRETYSKPHVDLKGLIQDQIINTGILQKNIIVDERCTIDHESLFYSYRREKEGSGRMAGIIKLNKLTNK